LFYLVLQILDRFGVSTALFHSHGALYVYVIALHALVIGGGFASARLLAKVRYLSRHASTPVSTNAEVVLSDELVETVAKIHHAGQHIEVVRLARVLSRPLWISGRCKARIAIGAYYEDSAGFLNQPLDQAAALIDDLGWTNVVLGNIDEARKNIKNGIDIAERADAPYLAAKGYRHLGVIDQKYLKHMSDAQAQFAQAELRSRNITDAAERDEMMAGIYFNRGEGLLQMLDYAQARKYCADSLEIYERLSDDLRRVKVKNLIAQVDMLAGDLTRAKQGFRDSLTDARKSARRDEAGKSLLGLGETHLRERSFELAEHTLKEAIDIFSDIGLVNELGRANELLRRAKAHETVA
jgi:tetratricopeptide (TPR) repeat protein